jgi:hypothetical protein
MNFCYSLVLDILLNFTRTVMELLFYVWYRTKFCIMSCWSAMYSDMAYSQWHY